MFAMFLFLPSFLLLFLLLFRSSEMEEVQFGYKYLGMLRTDIFHVYS